MFYLVGIGMVSFPEDALGLAYRGLVGQMRFRAWFLRGKTSVITLLTLRLPYLDFSVDLISMIA